MTAPELRQREHCPECGAPACLGNSPWFQCGRHMYGDPPSTAYTCETIAAMRPVVEAAIEYIERSPEYGIAVYATLGNAVDAYREATR